MTKDVIIEHDTEQSSLGFFFPVAMATDRCLAVTWPLKTKHVRTPRVAAILLIITWLVSILMAMPMPIGMNKLCVWLNIDIFY